MTAAPQSSSTQSRRPSLLLLIVIAIALGVVCGLFFPDWLTRVFVTFNGLFGQFLGFAIPLIIVGLIAPAIADLGRGAGKWLAITAAVAYLSTLIGGLMGLTASMAILPRVLPAERPLAVVEHIRIVRLAHHNLAIQPCQRRV